jgi:excisionase family DNA binding protein
MTQRRWVDINFVAAYLSLHHSTVRRKINKGEIPCSRIGRTMRIDLRKLEAQLENGK